MTVIPDNKLVKTVRRPPSAGMGRKKGVPNKSTKAIKAALIEAFDELGGVAALVRWGRNEPTDFYKLWAKLLPTEIKGDVGLGVTVVIQAEDSQL